MVGSEVQAAEGPWSPGLESTLPSAFLPLSTMFRAENVSTSLAEAQQLSALTGLDAHDLVAFRPERLVVHELLVRVTAELSVPVGDKYADLGINFRQMLVAILESDVRPHLPEIVAAHAALHRATQVMLEAELKAQFAPPVMPTATPASGWRRFLRQSAPGVAPPVSRDSGLERDLAVLAGWRAVAAGDPDMQRRQAFAALVRAASVVMARQGKLVREPKLIAALAATIVANEQGSILVGEKLDPYFRAGVARHNYRVLPIQASPIVMNVKGASASGKSTMRPLQQTLARRLGVDWDEFALISPDIWRKYLLDYDSLGPATKYAGMLAGHELEIVDRKLDRYMAHKAAGGRMSHLLIDRFRFDSFATGHEEVGSNLLTRFGDVIYMYFMITPPEATVERAWKRGIEFGRYKAVDDLLAHNVEAFVGMPRLFFTWAQRRDKRVLFEFLDNSVRQGQTPRTVAFGDGDCLNILDVKGMLDIERFHKINIDALSPEAVYPEPGTFSATANVAFLQQCVRAIPTLNFADQATGQIYARMQGGRWVWWDPSLLARASLDNSVAAAFFTIGGIPDGPPPNPPPDFPKRLVRFESQTLGQWG
jgi:hypothetical protein